MSVQDRENSAKTHGSNSLPMRFSVIMPLYNKAPYVKKAIESVMAQTWRDFELVVIDDGSSDDSYAVADAALQECKVPYQLVHQKNAGVSTARNNGGALSHGDYICFLDADDWWAPTFLEKMNGLIRDYPEAGIYGTNYYYVKNGVERVCIEGVETGYINYCRVYADRLKMPLTSISVAIPRHVFYSYKGFVPKIKLGEDFMLWIQIALSYKVAFLNSPLAYYNQDSDPVWRGVGHLVSPENHMLWNLDFLSEKEISDPDLKRLLDNLRTYGLLPFFISKQYHNAAKKELSKVEWGGQPFKIRFLYKMPRLMLVFRKTLLELGVAVKRRLNMNK